MIFACLAMVQTKQAVKQARNRVTACNRLLEYFSAVQPHLWFIEFQQSFPKFILTFILPVLQVHRFLNIYIINLYCLIIETCLGLHNTPIRRALLD